MATIVTKPKNGPAVSSVARFNTSGANPLEQSKSHVNRGGLGYVINIMFLFSIIGMSIKAFFGKETSKEGDYGPANTIIYGYGIVAFAVLTVMFVSFAIHDRIGRIENKSKPDGIMLFLKKFLTSSAPSLLTILILFWIITLNITYYTQINKGMVATEYYQLSTGTSFLFLFQIVCLFQYLKLYIQMKTDPKNAGADAVTTQNRIAFATYFITGINLIVVGMMTIILQFFSTDG